MDNKTIRPDRRILLTNCDEVFIEKMTGTKAGRSELDKMIGELRTGDIVKQRASLKVIQSS